MTSALQRLSDGTIELTITIPWSSISSAYDEHVKHTAQHAQVHGFRKGKVPKKLVEDKLDKTKIYEGVIRDILPKVYSEAISEQKLKPILVPKVELKEAKEGADWVIRALTCERPAVTLGDYKKAVTELKASKKQKIWTPGQEIKQGQQVKKDQPESSDKPTIDELLRTLFTTITITLPSLLIEHEVNRLLSELIDQTKKLGLTVEQYLASTQKTADTIRKEYVEQAKRTLSLEFALEDIADKENVFVSDDDIDTVIKSAKTDDERKTLTEQRYYIASVLRRQKTIDFLTNL